jgi:hypothetical protein
VRAPLRGRCLVGDRGVHEGPGDALGLLAFGDLDDGLGCLHADLEDLCEGLQARLGGADVVRDEDALALGARSDLDFFGHDRIPWG